MIHKTRGIVFRFTKYGETSIIVTIFTEVFGLQSYIVNGVRSKSAKNRIALYQPLTLLNLVVYHRGTANLERIKELHCFHPFISIPVDIRKSTIGLFVTELLNKTVKEESHAAEVFEFISTSLIQFDLMKANYENFHLIFMTRLAKYLGFGVMNRNEVIGGRVADEEIESLIQKIIDSDYLDVIPMSQQHRRKLLDLLVKFYEDHIESLGEFKSIAVLQEVLS